ncbi:GDSL esterase/lipase At2g42990-like [Papaver somniferum]|uniref:GDSL esterase/lipase At2g42990-like n=1 Tax=Papaver somniferum TaxID=3469 RepID=UPI000E701A35|nr:GDSL esterase/lipase At2g42990-like [Papaver somniferum]
MIEEVEFLDKNDTWEIVTRPKRQKHIDVRCHFIKDAVEEGKIAMLKVPTTDNPAEMLTKSAPSIKFKHCLELAVIPISEKLEYFKEYLKKLSSFLGKDGAVKITRESFYYIIIGTNDFILNYFTVPVRSLQFTVAEYEDFLLGIARNFLIELYSLGAINIVLAGVLPSGCLPFEYRA